MISSEMPELLVIDRILVMSNGRVAGIAETENKSQEIMRLAALYLWSEDVQYECIKNFRLPGKMVAFMWFFYSLMIIIVKELILSLNNFSKYPYPIFCTRNYCVRCGWFDCYARYWLICWSLSGRFGGLLLQLCCRRWPTNKYSHLLAKSHSCCYLSCVCYRRLIGFINGFIIGQIECNAPFITILGTMIIVYGVNFVLRFHWYHQLLVLILVSPAFTRFPLRSEL